MKAIQVKYLPTTRFKPSRYKAWAEGGHEVIVSASMYSPIYAAQLLCRNLGWHPGGRLVQGSLPNGDNVYVFDEESEKRLVRLGQ